MRLFAKFFLCAVFVISAALLISGYLLITFSYENAVYREAGRAANQFQYDKFAVQASLLSIFADSPETPAAVSDSVLGRLASEINGITMFFDADKRLLYSDIPLLEHIQLPGDAFDITDSTHVIRLMTIDGAEYITASGRITQSGVTLYMLVASDMSGIVLQREQMIQSFARIYFLTLIAGIAAVCILSLLITRPVKQINKAAYRIARGRYGERLPVQSGDEIGELAESFNLMAKAVEDTVYELRENARRKEDFVASFAHELKTPLTSVIGYADMLYQKNLPSDRVKDAAWYILNEGLRLEALSLKLMDLIVLDRQDFTLEETQASELFADISGGLAPLFDEKNAALSLDIEPAFIMIEYDLFKTLILNLIDNAVKAGGSLITVTGAQYGDAYRVTVTDNGRGMPEEELAFITEAFYTVDKSRSRRQHGAGLGLALAKRIAGIHGGRLEFKSAPGAGTIVSLDLVCKRGVTDE